MASGSLLPAFCSLLRTAARTTTSEETIAVSRRACSSAALMRTACSKSSVVIRTRSGMDVCHVRRVACGVCRVSAADEIYGMIEKPLEHSQTFLHTVSGAGEIDDQRLGARSGAAAREPGARK